MTEAAMGFALSGFAPWIEGALGQTETSRGATELSGGIAPYRTYETKDGRFMALAALEPKFWFGFCAATTAAQRQPTVRERRTMVTQTKAEGLYARQLAVGPMKNFAYLLGAEGAEEVAVVERAGADGASGHCRPRANRYSPDIGMCATDSRRVPKHS